LKSRPGQFFAFSHA